MFKNILLDNLTIGILVLDSNLEAKYLNKKMKNILKEQNIDEKYLNFLVKDFSLIENYQVKTYDIEVENQKFVQIEFHEIIEKSEYKLVTMLDTVQDFIFYLDSKGRIEYFNKAYAKYIGKSYLDIIGKKESEFFPKEMAEKCEANNRKALENGNFYEEKVKKLLEKKKNTIFSMMLLDIDKFKEINDNNGHDVGDLVLKKISEVLKRNVRKIDDFIIRIGGDEFSIIIEGTLKELEKIYRRIEKDILKENISTDLKFSISVGMAEREKEECLNSLYKKADIELYKMKDKKQKIRKREILNESNRII